MLTADHGLDTASGVDATPGPWSERQLHAARRLDPGMSGGRTGVRTVLGVLAVAVATFGLFGHVGRVLWESMVIIMAIDLGRLVALRLRRGATRLNR
jgi:hypothetical protein